MIKDFSGDYQLGTYFLDSCPWGIWRVNGAWWLKRDDMTIFWPAEDRLMIATQLFQNRQFIIIILSFLFMMTVGWNLSVLLMILFSMFFLLCLILNWQRIFSFYIYLPLQNALEIKLVSISPNGKKPKI